MRRLQIYIDEETDELLAYRAQREHRSKAALIRDAVRQAYGSSETQDALEGWAGSIDAEPGDVDSVVYDE
jgi:hypothetical protein